MEEGPARPSGPLVEALCPLFGRPCHDKRPAWRGIPVLWLTPSGRPFMLGSPDVVTLTPYGHRRAVFDSVRYALQPAVPPTIHLEAEVDGVAHCPGLACRASRAINTRLGAGIALK